MLNANDEKGKEKKMKKKRVTGLETDFSKRKPETERKKGKKIKKRRRRN